MYYNINTKKQGAKPSDVLPNIANANSLNNEELKKYFVYEVQEQPLNPFLQKEDGFEHIKELDIVQTKLIDLPLQDIAVLKADKLREAKYLANSKFAETEWYYHREIRTGKLESLGKRSKKDIPESVLIRDNAIYDEIDRIEAELNLLSTPEQVLTYLIDIKC